MVVRSIYPSIVSLAGFRVFGFVDASGVVHSINEPLSHIRADPVLSMSEASDGRPQPGRNEDMEAVHRAPRCQSVRLLPHHVQ
jgi:hypothetical protein